jgi:hypothetical protein
MGKYVPGERRDEPLMKLPTEDLMGNPVKPTGLVGGVTTACSCGHDLYTPEEQERKTCSQCWEERGQQDLAVLEASLNDVLSD